MREFQRRPRAFQSAAGFSTPETAVIVTALSLLSATVPNVNKYVEAARAATSGRAAETMNVTVTVVRSCAVDARPGPGSTASIRMTCSRGAVGRVRVGENLLDPAAGVWHVDAALEVDRDEQARVITLNF